MKRTLLALAISAASLNVAAHSNSCNYSLDYDINITDQEVRYSNKFGKVIVFTQDELSINGKTALLSNEQIKVSNRFQSETRILLPKVAEIAVEGAELGVKAVTIALTALVGDGENVNHEFIKPIEAISSKIKSNVSANKLNTGALEESFDKEFEQQIEKLAEKVIRKYSGKIISGIISSIFSEDSEDLKDFEFRMENLEHDIEQYVASHADELEIKAEALCGTFEKLAELDKQLETIKLYPADGLILNSSKKGLSISKFNVNF